MGALLRVLGLAALAAFVAPTAIGCGANVPNVLRQGAAVTCHAASAGYRALDKADDIEQQQVRRIAPNSVMAQTRLDSWLKGYKAVRAVLDEADDQCALAATAADRIDAHQAPPPGAPVNANVWLIDLLAFAPRIIAALADLGVKLDLGAK